MSVKSKIEKALAQGKAVVVIRGPKGSVRGDGSVVVIEP